MQQTPAATSGDAAVETHIDAGIDPGAVDGFVRAVEAERLGVHAIAVLHHGRMAATVDWSPYRVDERHVMFSVSKSFSATAIGIAQDEGLLDVDEPVLEFFGDHATPTARRNAGGLRLRHLLSMATGHEFDTMTLMRGLPYDDWVRIFLESPIVDPPGTRFLYNSGASYLLSAIIRARTGQRMTDFLTPRLFEPLGIRQPAWQLGPTGLELGASGLRLSATEMTAFGRLYLDHGRWQGRQLLSERWVDLTQQAHIATTGRPDWEQGYGFQFWRSRHNSYRADGAYGQFILILPEQQSVVAITSGSDRPYAILDQVWKHLLGALQGPPSDPATTGDSFQHRDLPTIALRPGRLADIVAGGQQPLPPLRLGAVSITAAEDGSIVLSDRDGTVERHIPGPDADWGPASISGLWPHEELSAVRMRSRAGFLDDGRFCVIQQCVETPFARVWTFSPRGREVYGEVTLDHGFWAPYTEEFVLTGQNTDPVRPS